MGLGQLKYEVKAQQSQFPDFQLSFPRYIFPQQKEEDTF